MAFAWGWQRRNAENELEATVQQRTADLQQANEALQAEMIERETAQKERNRTERALREAEAELARTSRLAAMAELAGAIAHEINQPLAAITANGSACLRSLKREPPLLENALEAAECIVADGHRAADVISRIRALFNKEQHQHQTLKINRVIVQVLELLRPELDRHQVQVKQELIEAEPPVSADPVQLQQVMVNLVTNAIEAMTEIADRPRQLVVRSQLDPAGNLVVVVEDSGQGIDPQQVSHVFDSFYTTKPNGIGLGLSISRSVIESHGGSIWAATSRAGGASVGFSLPIASAGEVATRVD
jgi:C4-dicarboxylate-specific signal transduction histidine kinase